MVNPQCRDLILRRRGKQRATKLEIMRGIVKRSTGLSQRNLKLALRVSQATLAREHYTEIIVAGRNMFTGTGNGFSKVSCRSFVITFTGDQQAQLEKGHSVLAMRHNY